MKADIPAHKRHTVILAILLCLTISLPLLSSCGGGLGATGALAGSSGGMAGHTVIDEPFAENKLSSIHPGQSSKHDIISLFGPPVVMLAPGEKLVTPFRFKVFIDTEPVWSSFRKTNKIGPSSMIYYYYYIDIYEGFVTRTKADIHNLWILIDTETGVAENFITTDTKTKIRY